MVNKIAYRSYPDKEEFSELYKNHTQRELCKVYGCAEARIRKWILYFELELRPQGGGNNNRYLVDKKDLEDFVAAGKSNQEIAKHYGMSVSNLKRILKSYSIKRNYSTKEYHQYARKVRNLTESTYAKYKEIINPNNHPRTLCGVKDGYQLDHIISVRECFDSKVSIEECADITNLQMIPWERNLQKRIFKKEFSKL